MSDHEKAVREAAIALQKAIGSAVASGYRVVWPGNAAALDKIEISETARVEKDRPAKLPQPHDPRHRPATDRARAPGVVSETGKAT